MPELTLIFIFKSVQAFALNIKLHLLTLPHCPIHHIPFANCLIVGDQTRCEPSVVPRKVFSAIHSSSAESGGWQVGAAPGAGRGSLECQGRGGEDGRRSAWWCGEEGDEDGDGDGGVSAHCCHGGSRPQAAAKAAGVCIDIVTQDVWTFWGYTVMLCIVVKGALCSFWEDILRDLCWLPFHDWINWISKLTLKDETVSYCLTFFICGGPCHLSSLKQCSGDLIFLWEQLVYSVMKNKYIYFWVSSTRCYKWRSVCGSKRIEYETMRKKAFDY